MKSEVEFNECFMFDESLVKATSNNLRMHVNIPQKSHKTFSLLCVFTESGVCQNVCDFLLVCV